MKVRRYYKRQRKTAACGQALLRVSLSFAAGAAAAVFCIYQIWF